MVVEGALSGARFAGAPTAVRPPCTQGGMRARYPHRGCRGPFGNAWYRDTPGGPRRPSPSPSVPHWQACRQRSLHIRRRSGDQGVSGSDRSGPSVRPHSRSLSRCPHVSQVWPSLCLAPRLHSPRALTPRTLSMCPLRYERGPNESTATRFQLSQVDFPLVIANPVHLIGRLRSLAYPLCLVYNGQDFLPRDLPSPKLVPPKRRYLEGATPLWRYFDHRTAVPQVLSWCTRPQRCPQRLTAIHPAPRGENSEETNRGPNTDTSKRIRGEQVGSYCTVISGIESPKRQAPCPGTSPSRSSPSGLPKANAL